VQYPQLGTYLVNRTDELPGFDGVTRAIRETEIQFSVSGRSGHIAAEQIDIVGFRVTLELLVRVGFNGGELAQV
jgi:hypothetical protein